ncbi:MAG: 4-alpha-glucanotransferase [Nevskia sp.]|nr:4-alpha-glucanotransferase [Nevskia sp.]
MSDKALHELAEAAGLSMQWTDYQGKPHTVSPEVARRILEALELPCGSPRQVAESHALLEQERSGQGGLPALLVGSAGVPLGLPATAGGEQRYRLVLESGATVEGALQGGPNGQVSLPPVAEYGYHRLQLGDRETGVAIAPPRGYSLDDVAGKRKLWGLTAQLYSLRRKGDGGIGDFTALGRLARDAGARGADAVAISPIHALFGADLDRYSPYAPSSRLHYNPLYADPAGIFGEAAVASAAAAEGVADARLRLEGATLIEWPEAARAKLALMRRLYRGFVQDGAGEFAGRRSEFERFCSAGGEALRDHAVFETLHAHCVQSEPRRWHWRDWPPEFRDPRGAAVAAFASEHADEVRFHMFLQWQAACGLRDAQAAARQGGMAIGIVGDLAVGADGGGSHGWSRQHDLLGGISVGAPPDLINSVGQNWGLTAFSPQGMTHHGYAPFIEMIRASLRHCGGLRIDHVLGMQRMWLVPEGVKATEGAYLRYPMEDLLRLIALESRRHRAVIIGEDLGTVPEGFRPRLSAAGILGLRVLWFEREWGLYSAPGRWQRDAVAMTTTHDLPTVAGWWRGRDIDWRTRLGLLGPGRTEKSEREERGRDRVALWNAFLYDGVAQGAVPPPEQGEAVADAAVAYVARTASQLALVPVEDLLGLVEQPNLPGTIDEHPNWRRRLPCEVEEVGEKGAARMALLEKERPRGG